LEFLGRVPEHFLPRRIETLEVSIGARNTEQVEREREISVCFFACVLEVRDVPEDEYDSNAISRVDNLCRTILKFKLFAVLGEQQRVVGETSYLPSRNTFLTGWRVSLFTMSNTNSIDLPWASSRL
jgi:hypothetical protein